MEKKSFREITSIILSCWVSVLPARGLLFWRNSKNVRSENAGRLRFEHRMRLP